MNSTSYSRAKLFEETEALINPIKVVSLFAGGGGSSTGYRLAGAKVVLASEYDPEAQRTYKANWPTTILIPDDIRNVSAQTILNKIGLRSGELDCLDGSPPCTAFSRSGRVERNWKADGSGVEDLSGEYIRILGETQPKTFVMENVTGLLVSKSKGFFNKILKGLRDCGYYVEVKQLSAKWFGVPQNRPRLIFIGIRNDLFRESMRGRLHPKHHSRLVTLRDAFQGLTITQEDLNDTQVGPITLARLKAMALGEQHKDRFNLYRCNPDDVCPTLTTNASSGPCHWDCRMFTISELKRIMSLPNDYILTGSHSQQHKRVGNMVAPFVARDILLAIKATGVFEQC